MGATEDHKLSLSVVPHIIAIRYAPRSNRRGGGGRRRGRRSRGGRGGGGGGRKRRGGRRGGRGGVDIIVMFINNFKNFDVPLFESKAHRSIIIFAPNN